MTTTHTFILLAGTLPDGSNFTRDEVIHGLARLGTAVLFAAAVWWLVRRLPWPRPFRLSFALTHLWAAPALATTWFVVSSAISSLVLYHRIAIDFYWLTESLVLGSALYVLVAGIAYGVETTARAARAEAVAARSQLAALRAQLHPHFLFNALHTVVQLIPTQPARAAEAAELLADLLRTTVDEQRDEVTLDDEWRFVSRYLAMEQIRFGDRLVVRAEIAPELRGARLPSFALQTLVENAVVHGAAPRVAPTEILVTATGTASGVTLSVRNTGDGMRAGAVAAPGTGLARLRERLTVLYGGAARLTSRRLDDGGFESLLVVPRVRPT